MCSCLPTYVGNCVNPILGIVSERAFAANEQCSLSQRVNFFYQGIARLFLVPRMIGGACLGMASCLTGGRYPVDGNFSQIMLQGSEKVVAYSYVAILGTLYPELAGSIEILTSITEEFLAYLIRPAEEKAQSQHWFERHVESRMFYVGAAVCMVVARLVTGFVAMSNGFCALIPFFPFFPGKQGEDLRRVFAQIAFNELQFPGIIKDVLFCATRVVNPWSEVYYNGVVPQN